MEKFGKRKKQMETLNNGKLKNKNNGQLIKWR